MRALVLDDDQLRLVQQFPDPISNDKTVVVKPTRMGICDTDLQILQGYMGFSGVLGHEFVGVVHTRNSVRFVPVAVTTALV